jgi:hypothetical protein
MTYEMDYEKVEMVEFRVVGGEREFYLYLFGSFTKLE